MRRTRRPFSRPLNKYAVNRRARGGAINHVQAIMVAIDQYAEAATGNREYFLNKPHSIGGTRKSGDVP
jgi:hypothetical protein